MNRLSPHFKSLTAALVVVGAVLAISPNAMADKVTLKDGTVYVGTVIAETESFVRIKIKIGGIESIQTLDKNEISKVERDTPGTTTKPVVPTGSDKPDKEKTKEEKKAESDKMINSGATRVAILNFGPPSYWGQDIGTTVGVEICAHDFARAVPLLEKDKVQVVVVRINSGGGALSEMEPFQKLFQDVYKPKFRTVAWVESAISCAAMSPYPIEEFYFLPNGNLGACTAWHGSLQNMEGIGLEMVKAQMETCSAWGKRDPKIMLAMQIQVPLSATIDPVTGEVHWFQDTTGEHLLNPPNQILTLTANDAVKYKFAKGIAATKEELAKVMGLGEVVWAGEEATKFVDDQLRASDKAQKRWQTVYTQYAIQVEFASQSQDRDQRGAFVGTARRYLNELRQMFGINRNFGMATGVSKQWFDEQEQLLRDLMR